MDKNTESQNVTLSVDEARAMLGNGRISRGAFYAAVARGEVPRLRLGHRYLIPRAAFLKWLESAGQPQRAA